MDRPEVDRDKPLISRRTAIGGAIGGGLVTLLAPQLAMAEAHPRGHGPPSRCC